MINLNDHYFIAWLHVEKGIKYSINNLNRIGVDINSSEYSKYLEEYSGTMKPLLKKIRRTVKELNSLKT